MTHLNQTDGLEDPFTGPGAAATRSCQPITTARVRGQQTMSALSQTLSSRLNSVSHRSSSAKDYKSSVGFSPRHRSPAAATPMQENDVTMASSLLPTLGARPIARSRSSSTTKLLVNCATIISPHVTPRRSTSGLSMSSSHAEGRGAQMGPLRSISGHSKVSSRPSLRSNVRKSSSTTNQAALSGANEPKVCPSTSNSTIAHVPSTSPNSQPGSVSAVPASVFDQPSSSPSMITVSAVHQLPPLPARQRPLLDTFAVFPELPPELQQEIWSIAIAYQYHKEKRFLRVAPDPKSLDRNNNDAEVAQLRIISDIHRRPRLIPSLLHVCHYTRNVAIKGYKLWGCADPITYEKNNAMVYVKVDIDNFFFGDANLGEFWVLHTFLMESEPENADADNTARGNFIEDIGLIKHFTFDYELWVQLLEYDSLWLANLDSADQITVAIRNPNHEQFNKDYALSHVKPVIQHTFGCEAAKIILHMTLSSLAESRQELQGLNWPENGHLDLNVRTLALGNATSNTPEDESYLEDVLIEGNRAGLVSDQYLEARLAMIHAKAPQPLVLPPSAPVPTQIGC